MTRWYPLEPGRGFTRLIVRRPDGEYAVVRLLTPYGINRAEFALPPSGTPTGRLWAHLERQLME